MDSINYNTPSYLLNDSPIKEISIQIAKITIVAGVIALLATATFLTSGLALSIGGPVFNFWLLENSVAGLAWGATVGLGASATLVVPIAAYTSNMHKYSPRKNTTDIINFFRNTILFTTKTVGFCLFAGTNNLGKITLCGYILSLIENKTLK